MHPFYSLYRSSDQLPSHNQPALKGKAESFISINHSPLHYHRYNLQTSCVKLNLDIDWSIFTPLPTLPPTDPHSDPSARLCLRFQPQCFDEARYLYLKTTCNFLVSQGGRCFTATCWVSTCAFCISSFRVITASLDSPVQDTSQSERTQFMCKISACLVFFLCILYAEIFDLVGLRSNHCMCLYLSVCVCMFFFYCPCENRYVDYNLRSEHMFISWVSFLVIINLVVEDLDLVKTRIMFKGECRK